MKDNFPFFLVEIYEEHLATINGLQFTRREIDIISILINLRGTSKIASLLSISPNTVLTHIRNIMLKMECHSREGIIDFIESAGKQVWIKKYYSSLRLLTEFQICLREINKKNLSLESFQLKVFTTDETIKKEILAYLKQHLLQAKIYIEVSKPDLPQDKTHEDQTPNLIISSPQSHKGDNLEVRYENLILKEGTNYFSAVFKIIEKILPTEDISKLAKKIQSLSMRNLDEPFPPLGKDIDVENSPENEKVPLKSIGNKKRSLFFFISVLFVIGISTFFYKHQFSAAHVGLKETRSDLIIPTDTSFVERHAIMQKISEAFANKGGIQVVVLAGAGGIGKTTLARKYAHSQNAPIIWEINAEGSDSLADSLENLGEALISSESDQKEFASIQKIESPNERERKILAFVKVHLKRNPNWLLLFDNVEKYSDIQHTLPNDPKTWGDGHVLITSRDSNLLHNRYVHKGIIIGELNHEEKLELFTKIMHSERRSSLKDDEARALREFLNKIPSYPLDVSLAAYYIKATNISFDRYLENLIQNHKDFQALEESLLHENGHPQKTRHGIVAASAKQILHNHPEFSKLLLFISLIDSQNIPYELLIQLADPRMADSFIYNLKKYSFITKETASPSFQFSIHRSTQQALVSFFKNEFSHRSLKDYLQQISLTFEQDIGKIVKAEDVDIMKKFMPHYESFLHNSHQLASVRKTSIYAKLGYMAYIFGNYEKAKKHLETSLDLLKREGSQGSERAWILSHLGQSYRSLGEYEKAKESLEESCALYRSSLLSNEREYAQSLVYLGNIWRDLGDYRKAEELVHKGLVLKQKKLPLNELEFAEVLTYQALILWFGGNYDQAKTLLERSYAIFNKILPKNHYRIAWSMSHLGNIYGELGEKEKAKQLLEKSLLIYKTINYEDQDDIPFALTALAKIYKHQNNPKKAAELLTQSLPFHRNHCPKYNLILITHEKNIPDAPTEASFYRNAEQYAKLNLESYKSQYGLDHICTARGMWILSQIYLVQGQLEKAEELLERAASNFEKNKHPEVYTCYESLALIDHRKVTQAHNKEEKVAPLKKQVAHLMQAKHILISHYPPSSVHRVRIESKLKELENFAAQGE